MLHRFDPFKVSEFFLPKIFVQPKKAGGFPIVLGQVTFGRFVHGGLQFTEAKKLPWQLWKPIISADILGATNSWDHSETETESCRGKIHPDPAAVSNKDTHTQIAVSCSLAECMTFQKGN